MMKFNMANILLSRRLGQQGVTSLPLREQAQLTLKEVEAAKTQAKQLGMLDDFEAWQDNVATYRYTASVKGMQPSYLQKNGYYLWEVRKRNDLIQQRMLQSKDANNRHIENDEITTMTVIGRQDKRLNIEVTKCEGYIIGIVDGPRLTMAQASYPSWPNKLYNSRANNLLDAIDFLINIQERKLDKIDINQVAYQLHILGLFIAEPGRNQEAEMLIAKRLIQKESDAEILCNIAHSYGMRVEAGLRVEHVENNSDDEVEFDSSIGFGQKIE